jgi:hypothetical protein
MGAGWCANTMPPSMWWLRTAVLFIGNHPRFRYTAEADHKQLDLLLFASCVVECVRSLRQSV